MVQKVQIYDTTLRDGNQARGISLSLADKLQLTRRLDRFGIDYIEGGWPNPTSPLDMEYFKEVQNLQLKHAKVVAFGSTRRAGNREKIQCFAISWRAGLESSPSLERAGISMSPRCFAHRSKKIWR